MTTHSLLSLFSAQGAGDKKAIGNLHGASLALAIAELANAHTSHTLLAVPDPQTALKLLHEVEQFSHSEVALFPDWETLPYDNFSPHQDIISDRISRLYQLPSLTRGITIVPVSTLLQRQSPRDFLLQHTLIVKRGDHFSLDKLRLQLENSSYRHVDQVFGPGEYASRGSILDLFPMGSSDPFRIDFFDDEIDTIRTFDPDNQRSIAEMDEIRLLP
ncbi:TPA: transcription-repair coupling factor, partial [Vibrio cholerae]